MESQVKRFLMSDGYGVYCRCWEPERDKPKGYVVALHGIQSHSGWYEYSSQALCNAGYFVCFMDRRGSGMNHEKRGDAPHHERLINDVLQVVKIVRCRRNEEAPVSPVILSAVSWGGKLAAATAARRPELIDGLALLYPGIRARIRPTTWQRCLLTLAGAVGVRNRSVPIPLSDPALFTGVARWQEYIRQDPLTLHEATVGFLLADRELNRLADAAPERVRCPVLLMLAGKDQIIDNHAMRLYFDRFASNHRGLLEYPEAQHTLEFEPNRDRFVADVIEWLDSVRIVC